MYTCGLIPVTRWYSCLRRGDTCLRYGDIGACTDLARVKHAHIWNRRMKRVGVSVHVHTAHAALDVHHMFVCFRVCASVVRVF